jgi:hypothetical protein
MPDINQLRAPYFLQAIPLFPKQDDENGLVYKDMKKKEFAKDMGNMFDLRKSIYKTSPVGNMEIYLVSKKAEANLENFKKNIKRNILFWNHYVSSNPSILVFVYIQGIQKG